MRPNEHSDQQTQQMAWMCAVLHPQLAWGLNVLTLKSRRKRLKSSLQFLAWHEGEETKLAHSWEFDTENS